jgi:hypothetical protein
MPNGGTEAARLRLVGRTVWRQYGWGEKQCSLPICVRKATTFRCSSVFTFFEYYPGIVHRYPLLVFPSMVIVS